MTDSLVAEGEFLRYRMSLLSKIGAFGGEPKARVSNLKQVTQSDNPWTREVLRGIRAPGTGFPFLIMLGTMRYRGGKDFCAVYKRNPVLILEFNNENFNRWVIPANETNKEVLRDLKKLAN